MVDGPVPSQALSAGMKAWLAKHKIMTDIAAMLDELGVVDQGDLVDVDDEDVEEICKKLKKTEACDVLRAYGAARSLELLSVL